MRIARFHIKNKKVGNLILLSAFGIVPTRSSTFGFVTPALYKSFILCTLKQFSPL